MKANYLINILMAFSVCFSLLFLYEFQRITQKVQNIMARRKMTIVTFEYTRSARIDSALGVANTDYEIIKPKAINSPFNVFDTNKKEKKLPPKKTTVSKNQYIRKYLLVKGIALHGKGLVILEDAESRTYIKNPGDTVLGQIIIKINEEEVVLRDKLGTYTLSPLK